MCVIACVHVRMCVRICMRHDLHARARARVRVCVRAVCVYACMCVWEEGEWCVHAHCVRVCRVRMYVLMRACVYVRMCV